MNEYAESIPLSLQRQIDALCVEFEEAWKAGHKPRIEDYLPEQGRSTALRELIAQEVDLRQAARETVEGQEYHERFPNDRTAVDAAFAMLERREQRPQVADTQSLVAVNGPETEEGAPTAVDDSDSIPQRLGRFEIESVLGKGAFGAVYLARDSQLNRPVALKVPRGDHFSTAAERNQFVQEARTAAQLNHPGIVTVYDVAQQDRQVFIVQEYIEGQDLAAYLKSQSPSTAQIAELMTGIAEAVAFAHQKGFVHRDLKPANILLDQDGRPRVADFGLAVHESIQRHRRGERSGTPAYMSPEQVRGETHRLDGRSDIWSLGVILYEMLVGRWPFSGDRRAELFEEIKHRDPKPPRMMKPDLPAELERICLKCLAKRITDRYSNAADLAADLRRWPEAGRALPQQTEHAKVIPKGWSSFDARDADFFLELLPGPRDRAGLPESLRFWKSRIEETDADKTFAVGLIYGPSGCGKSSLVKAGLLPRLTSHVTPVYIEATPTDTETHLLRRLCSLLTDVPNDVSLPELLAGLREGAWVARGKILLVLDQFEQWLHANRGQRETQLLQALRHCDGARAQCVLLVRDDFWLATSRFMQGLEIRLIEAENQMLVDLFDPLHARKVLAEFGRAFSRLPDNLAQLSGEQEEFLDLAVEGLARDGKVVCVRLSLFADMIKGAPWTPATLNEVGGTEGLGETFLEETFSATTAPREHQLHQQAARAVLTALLPDKATDLKGGRQSYSQLLADSGYGNRESDFADLIRILDAELRLITPVDPEGTASEGDGPKDAEPEEQYYQLTHDYLVPSLRGWLTRKQKETRRGRAELRLEELSASWHAKPENRHLPSVWEWVNIRALTQKKKWAEPQRKMMSKAGRLHGSRLIMLLLLAAVAARAGRRIRDEMVEQNNDKQAAGFVRALVNADLDQVPGIVTDVSQYRQWADPRLADELQRHGENSNERLNVSLALLPSNPGQLPYLKDRMLGAEPDQVRTVRLLLKEHQDELVPDLWRVAVNPDNDESLLQAASALALFDADSRQWQTPGLAQRVVVTLVRENPLRAAAWTETLKPLRRHLLGALQAVFVNAGEAYTLTERDLATDILATYAADDPETLGELILVAQPNQFVALFDEFQAHGVRAVELMKAELDRTLQFQGQNAPSDPAGTDADLKRPMIPDSEKETLARRQANAAVAVLRMGEAEPVWPLLKHHPDSRLRTWIIHRLSALGAGAASITQRLETETDNSIRGALLLCLGDFSAQVLGDRQLLTERLLDWYENDPDPGIHAAAEWVLRRWGHAAELAVIDQRLASGKVEADRSWYVNGQGHTMVVFEPIEQFLMGSPDNEPNRDNIEERHRRRIGRRYALASKEVTVTQFQRFLQQNPSVNHFYPRKYAPEPECPQVNVTWYEAAAYCRWLSEQAGIDEDQMCYPEIADIKEGMRLPANYLSRSGYRLPTEAEWEYGCRALAATSRYYGQTNELLVNYAWYRENTDDRSWPVGKLSPNSFGLFDMYGNVWEWCQSHADYWPKGQDGQTLDDREDTADVSNLIGRTLRGGSYDSRAAYLRSAKRHTNPPNYRIYLNGFRVARSYR